VITGTDQCARPADALSRTYDERTHTDRRTDRRCRLRAGSAPTDGCGGARPGRHGRSTRSARFTSRHGASPTDRPRPFARPPGLPAHLRCATGASMPHNDLFGGLLGTPHSVDSATLHSVDLYSDDRSRLAGHLSTHMPRPAACNPNHGPVAGRRGWGCAELGGADGRLRGSAFRVCASQDPKTGLSQHCACH
jgi:hypothetical protein